MLLTISIPTSLIVLVSAVILIIALLYLKEKNKSKKNKSAEKSQSAAPQVELVSVVREVERIAVLKSVRPDSAHSNEDKLEAFLSKRGYPKTVSSHDMLNSGVNMNALGYLNGTIGKYRFTRDSFVGDWTITKTE